MTIDLDQLINGECTIDEVREFFQSGEFCEESYLVQAIEKHLVTEEQRKQIYDQRLSIEKMLNGRYGAVEENAVQEICGQWNANLGFKFFGS